MNQTCPCSTIKTPLFMILAAGILLALPTASVAQERGADKGRQAITFSKLLLHNAKTMQVAMADGSYAVHIIEEMRRKGYNAVGAENLLFNQDESYKADLVLGGTVHEVACSVRGGTGRTRLCNISVTWELFDKREGQVVYKALTWFRGQTQREGIGTELVIGALRRLLVKPRFNEMLNRTVTREQVTYSDAYFRRCAREDLSLPEEMDKVLDATFVVKPDEDSFGTGFIISPDGLALTALHVVDDSPTCKVTFKSGFSLTAKVLRTDPERDVALLSIPMEDAPCIPVAETTPGPGSKLFAAGTPIQKSFAFSISSGVLSGVREIDGVKIVQTDASVNPGNSGGPLLDDAGRAVAVVVRKTMAVGVEGLGFGVPAKDALDYLSMKEGDSTGKISATAIKLTAKPAFPIVDTPEKNPMILIRRQKMQERYGPAAPGEPRFLYSKGKKALFGVSLGLTGLGVALLGYSLYDYSVGGELSGEGSLSAFFGGVFGVAGLTCLWIFLATAKPKQKDEARIGRLEFSIAPGPGSLAIAGRF